MFALPFYDPFPHFSTFSNIVENRRKWTEKRRNKERKKHAHTHTEQASEPLQIMW